EELVNLGMTTGAAVNILDIMNELRARLEPFMLDCTATYKKNKKKFSIAINDWTLLQRKIRTEFLDLLEDVDESEITIKPSANNVIKDKETFYSFLENVPKLNGLKRINFNVET
ncbi:396_t:CDS:2, partial [Paraglomus brasilianum]